MNVQVLLAQLFEEAGYTREKQVRMKRLSFVGPCPGTYRFDKWYANLDCARAYLTTKKDKKLCEFYVDGNKITVYETLQSKTTLDLTDPDSLEKILDLIKETDEDSL
jgi:hypothetical protein